MLDLKVLDPAMGSGHFLVTAVDFLSDKVAELVEDAPEVPEWLDGEYASPLVDRVAAVRRDILDRARQSDWVIDEAQLTDQAILRRMVLKRCIYGVDKNPLTVELAKVSLWLHSFTVGAPLSFLDHHLRRGDSLVGMRVLEATGSWPAWEGCSHSAIAGAEAATASGMQRIEEMSDADVAEVRESASLFRASRRPTADLRGLLDFPVRPALADRRDEGQGAGSPSRTRSSTRWPDTRKTGPTGCWPGAPPLSRTKTATATPWPGVRAPVERRQVGCQTGRAFCTGRPRSPACGKGGRTRVRPAASTP